MPDRFQEPLRFFTWGEIQPHSTALPYPLEQPYWNRCLKVKIGTAVRIDITRGPVVLMFCPVSQTHSLILIILFIMLLRLAWITLAGHILALGPLVFGSLPLQTGLVVALCLVVAGTLLVIASVRPGSWSVHDHETTRQGRASIYGAEVLLLMTLVIEGVGFFVIAFYYMWRLL